MAANSFLYKIKAPWIKYRTWKEKSMDTLWYRIFTLFCNVILSLGAVIPMIYMVCTNIPFSYEVNDDATVAQILDGSYTGQPEAHAIFVRYPLSWLMQQLYKINPKIDIGGLHLSNVNWYVAVLMVLETFALAAVLFRFLNYFTYNRFLICIIFDMAFLILWLPCFSDMTFSTAAAFFGCMGLLFFSLESKEEAWRPWNLLILGVLLMASWCLRKPCLYMVLPFLAIEMLVKYHIHFFRSVKPWVICAFFGALFGGIVFLNGQMYGSQEWKQYFIYNHARAYLQDYVGFPEYEEEKELYDFLGMDEAKRNAMAKYTYCLVDDFDTDWVETVYLYVKSKEEPLSLQEKVTGAKETAMEYLREKNQADAGLKTASFYVWLVLIPLFPISLIFCWKKGIGSHIGNLITIWGTALFLAAEWIYLAVNGRFPQRVEETIRLLMLCAGIMLVSKLLHQWKDASFTRIPAVLQIIILVVVLRTNWMQERIIEIKGTQEYNLTYASEKGEVLSYCGEHPENYYVLDTQSFSKMSKPSDNLHQGNWFMSGSWAAYSPLYQEKLEENDIQSLGSEFLLRDNVFVITKGKKNMATLLGIADKDQVEAEIVEEIMTDNNSFFEVYKIEKISQK